MNILLTGATGYIGGGVLTALLEAGHNVTTLMRNEDKAAAVRKEGGSPVIGNMQDHDLVRRLAEESDGVIATASPGDASSSDADTDFADAVLAGLTGSGRPFIRTGGAWVHGAGDQITEQTPVDAPAIVRWRPEIDGRVLTRPGIRAVLIEPGIVYGRHGGIPNVIFAGERTGNPPALTLVGDGTQHWTTVHVDDLARLYVAALGGAEHGSRFLGVSGQNPTTRELGEAASHRLGLEGRVVPETAQQTIERLGAFGEALLLDQQAAGRHARETLGWAPTRPSLLNEIAAGEYDPASL